MIAVIEKGRDIKTLLDYHEQKIHAGEACLFDAIGFLGRGAFLNNLHRLTYQDKLGTFQHYLDRKRGLPIEIVSFHAMLRFAPGETRDRWEIKAIINEYMEGVGYGKQPYLIYQQIKDQSMIFHMIAPTVDRNGDRIKDDLYKIRSEKVRKGIEERWKLIPAEGSSKTITCPVEYEALVHSIRSLALIIF